MTREEAEQRGIPPEETIQNGHRRASWHDYRLPGIYMLTLVTEGRQRAFGTLTGRTRAAKGEPDAPHVELSELGCKVLSEEVPKISEHYPQVEVWKTVVMPDHLHMLVCVREVLPEGRHLGQVVRGFKTGCTRAWWRWQDEGGETRGTSLGHGKPQGQNSRTDTVPAACPTGSEGIGLQEGGLQLGSPEGEKGTTGLRPLLFKPGYHDRIVRDREMLDNIRRYMDENPFRAVLRQEVPQLMQRRLHLWIHDREYAAFGNLFLLKYPDKVQVFFHRKANDGTPTHLTAEYAQARDALLQRAEEGTVLVTPGISKGEQGVMTEALRRQLPLILLQK